MSIFLSGQEIITKNNATKGVIKLYNKAQDCVQNQKPEKAIKKLNSAIAKEPQFIDAYLLLGGIQYDLKDYDAAIHNFEKAFNLDSTYSPKVLQALALCYEAQKDNAQASLYFRKFLDNADRLKPEYVKEVEKKIRDFDFREEALKNPVPFTPEILPAEINQPKLSEYSPSLTADGRRLFFTRITKSQEDIYYTEKDTNGMWQEARLLPNLNTLENEGAHNISADGKTILFTYCSNSQQNNVRGCNIYVSFKNENSWSKPVYFDAINSKSWDTQPNISADGKTIIFVSKRPGGKGDSDLWWTRKNKDGKWTIPENLSAVINTPYREESPFFHPDGKTLYFKSEGHPGMGSFDLFKSELLADSTWSEPENLGYPINTEDHEGAMIVSLDGKTAYYSRGNGKIRFDQVQSDLYTFELPEAVRSNPVGFLSIRVFDAETKLPLEAIVRLQSSDDNTRETLNTGKDASLLIVLPLGENYSLNIDKKNYYFYSERFELEALNTAETAFEIDVYLKKIEEKQAEDPEPVILKNVLFATGSYELEKESFFELDQLANLLEENVNIQIEIQGHTDNVGNDDDNQQLSENRAKAVNNYLIQKGISKDRLTFVGYGETEPISSNETEEGRKINRRTTFIIKE
ncbi:OmpA family protein [Portibacter lacus]|uniref:Membrane protein n=1 Tax=Portibacter lacus TaxID=1099794 RepID=A0AA37SRV5_9BACT|nr:OmpA family protein [Portibacter lacus]GLR18937.1 membrane protein [Portibacter lacus]